MSCRREIRTISRLTAPPAASSEGVARGRGGARSPAGAESGAELSGSGGSGDEDYSPGDTWHTHQYRYTQYSTVQYSTVQVHTAGNDFAMTDKGLLLVTLRISSFYIDN